MRIRKYLGAVLIAGAAIGMSGGVAMAGEVTGSGKGGPNDDGTTGMIGKAKSECAYSGLEDKPANEGQADNVKPGRLTQTPHYFYNDGGAPGPLGPTFPPPGTPGFACRGN